MTALSELCTSVDYGYTASASDDPSAGPKFLRITDIVPDSINWGAVPHCEIEDRKLEKFLLNEGDIVVARTGATVGYAKQIWARPESATFASYLVRFRPDAAKVNPYYLGQIIQSAAFKKWVKSVAGGAAQPNANARLLGSYEVVLPDLDIQRSVVRAVMILESLMENNRRRIEILEEMARLLYREWFVYFRFPGHEDVKLLDSDLGPIPEGWEVGEFSKLVSEVSETIAPEEIADGTPVVGLEHLPRRSTTLCEWEQAENVGSRRKLFVEGDILFGKIRPYFHKVVDAPIAGCCTPSAIIFRPREKLFQCRALAIASSDAFVGVAVATSNGTIMPNANAKVLMNYGIPHPTRDVEQAFREALEPMNRLRKNLAAQNRVLREARDLLLPRLVSGELDVSELDLNLEAVGA
ncbi:MAG: hypothetical protein F4119_00635 [Acidimicrobiia bacterium]|nr:hypothetical protein [Acidimicrobiia bacterium]